MKITFKLLQITASIVKAKSLSPTILYLAESKTNMQFKAKVQRKGIQSDAELFNESLELPMRGIIASLIQNRPFMALAFWAN